MFHKQSGLYTLPSLLIGVGLILYFFAAWLVNVSRLLLEVPLHQTLFLGILLGIGFSQPILIGIGTLGMYPDVHLTSDGLVYRFRLLPFISGKIFWQDVTQVVLIKSRKRFRGCYAILLENKRPARWFTRSKYFFNFFYARLANFYQPILLLSPDLAEQNNIAAEITKNIKQLHSPTS